MLVSARELASDARRNGYAIGAFNVGTVDGMAAVIRAAQARRSPVIAMLWSGAVDYVDVAGLSAAMVTMARAAEVPVVVHLDHAYSLDLVSDSLDRGFSSVMFDGAALPLADNIAGTAEAVRMARAHGASVEAVVGEIGREYEGETGAEVQATDPEQAAAFARAVEVDLLAIAIGTRHGHYAPGAAPSLDVPLTERVAADTGVPLVLHGGSYAPDDQVKAVVAAGVAKVNVATELEDAYLGGVREVDLGTVRFSAELSAAGCARVQRLIEAKLDLFGSTGRA